MPGDDNEAEIGRLVETWAKAVRAKDIDGATANHTDDIVMFDVPMPLRYRGLVEYRRTWDLFFANNAGGPGSFDVTELRIAAGDSVAFCHAILKIFDANARLTMGLHKVKGRWLIAHEHHSYPMELDPDQ